MGERRHDCAKLLICLLYLLTRETKAKISYFVDNNILDRALKAILDKDQLPDWFKRYFSGFDPLYSVLHGLSDLFATSLRLMLIGYDMGRPRTPMVLVIGESYLERSLRELEIEREGAAELSRILEEELLRIETRHREFMSQQRVVQLYGHYL